MALTSRQERAATALEAASRVYEGKGDEVSAGEVLGMADRFLRWIEEKY